MTYVLEFELPGLPRMLNSGKGQSRNWRAAFKEKRTWKNKTFAAAFPRRPSSPLPRARIIFVRCSPTRPDSDGLAAGFKAIQDGLVLAKVIANDKHVNIGTPVFTWEPAPAQKGKVKVRLEELPEDYVHSDNPGDGAKEESSITASDLKELRSALAAGDAAIAALLELDTSECRGEEDCDHCVAVAAQARLTRGCAVVSKLIEERA